MSVAAAMTAAANMAARARLLVVDDDATALANFTRNLRSSYDLSVAGNGADALALIERDGPFAVIIADARMPGIDGFTVLQRAAELAPQSTRVLLADTQDLVAAMTAVNEGHAFRFLLKALPPAQVTSALVACVEQNRLVAAERELLERTLRGAVVALMETLSMTHPLAFGRAIRLRARVAELLKRRGVKLDWAIEVAAMLAQLGAVSLPKDVLERVQRGEILRPDEKDMVDRAERVGEALVVHLPRLERVHEILRYAPKRFDGKGPPHDALAGEELPLGARLLRVVDDYDTLETRGMEPSEAIELLRSREGVYDPSLLGTLAEVVAPAIQAPATLREVRVAELRVGMVLVEDVYAQNGLLLVTRGHEVSVSLFERLRNFQRVGVREPLVVRVPAPFRAPARS
jgi:response regulator RpfG family c-di-GMP phosphodiesterase